MYMQKQWQILSGDEARSKIRYQEIERMAQTIIQQSFALENNKSQCDFHPKKVQTSFKFGLKKLSQIMNVPQNSQALLKKVNKVFGSKVSNGPSDSYQDQPLLKSDRTVESGNNNSIMHLKSTFLNTSNDSNGSQANLSHIRTIYKLPKLKKVRPYKNVSLVGLSLIKGSQDQNL